MALRYAVATGNWSSTSTWDGGTLPTSADDVYANGFTVTIDTSPTVLSVRTTAGAPAVAGGGFTLSGGQTLTTTGSGVIAGSTSCITFSSTGTSSIVSTASGVTGSATTPSMYGVNITGTGTLNITGPVNGGTAGSGHGVVVAAGASLNVVGNMNPGTTNNGGICIQVTGANSTINVTGNVMYRGGNGTPSVNVVSVSSTVTFTGSVLGSNNGSGGIQHSGTGYTPGSVTITGDVKASDLGPGVYITGTANLFVTGNVYGEISGNVGIYTNVNHDNRFNIIVGDIYASVRTLSTTTGTGAIGGHGVYDTNGGGGFTAIAGSRYDSRWGDPAVYARRLRIIPTLSSVLKQVDSSGWPLPNGTMVTYANGAYSPSQPSTANVRSGTVYANGSLTGTLAMPQASDVAAGARVGNTVGTASMTLGDMAHVVGTLVQAAVSS